MNTLAPEGAIVCRCSRSVGALSAMFASLAVLALLAQDGCLDGGGRLSDAAWVCEMASGASVSIWSSVPALTMGLVAIGVGVPVYLGVNALVGRLIAMTVEAKTP